MQQKQLEKMLAALSVGGDTDVVMALRAVSAHLQEKGVTLEQAVLFADTHAAQVAADFGGNAPAAQAAASAPRAPLQVSGMPQTRVTGAGEIEIVPPGQEKGTVIQLQGVAVQAAEDIGARIQDALVAATINKSRFKLKLVDRPDGKGGVAATVLQAEYDRDGMSPVEIWSNLRGEVATLATLLRRMIKESFPDFAA